ncbi:hypothetical protein PGB90_009981 [Kerria lacca]
MDQNSEVNSEKLQELQNMAHKLRIHSIESTNASKSGHPTSCSSIAEIMSVLFFHVMRYKVTEPRHPANDRLVLSKGHSAPILYATWAETGLFPTSELLNLRKIDSDLEGHPTPRLNFVDVATGSLGQGLSIAVGMAYMGKYFDKVNYKTFCIIGDGESAEGNIWEALNFSSFYKLDNLCAIFDINRLGQSDPTMLQHQMDVYENRLMSFGFRAIIVDGHDINELCKAFSEADRTKGKPTAIIAKTFKGKYFLDIENAENWHGKALGDKAKPVIQHLRSLIKSSNTKLDIASPETDVPLINISNIKLSSQPKYTVGEPIATRLTYGVALKKLVENNKRIIALDGDTKNSTYSEKVKEISSDNFIECFIAEQNLVGVAIGIACRDRAVVFVSAFAAFFTRTFDQIRMGAISQTNVNFVGSHCGVSIGEDGPSQMGLEDLAMFRSIPGSTVFYPSDAVSTEKAVELAANTKGICFIRTTRAKTPVLYCNDANFKIGKGCVIKKSNKDKVLIIAAGITLYEAIEAYKILANEHLINVRIFDPFTIKPIDSESIIFNAKECNNLVITVEDHYYEGGLGEAVLSALAESSTQIKLMAVESVPRSGPSKELLKLYKISAQYIVDNVLKIIH